MWDLDAVRLGQLTITPVKSGQGQLWASRSSAAVMAYRVEEETKAYAR
jgi:hypothetical protein